MKILKKMGWDTEMFWFSIRYILLYGGFIALVWTAQIFLSDSVSDYEVIQPKPGVECVVVSRMFNTSVDCWELSK